MTEARVNEIYSSIHAIIPKAKASCFVCRQPGALAAQFVAVKSMLTPEELHKFWFLLRKRYAIDLRDRERAAVVIEARVMEHLRSTGLYEPPAQTL